MRVTETKRVAFYAQQETTVENPDAWYADQVIGMKSMLAEHPDCEMCGIFTDMGIPGTPFPECPGFQSLYHECENADVDLIVAFPEPRLFGALHEVLDHLPALNRMGVAVIIVTDGDVPCQEPEPQTPPEEPEYVVSIMPGQTVEIIID